VLPYDLLASALVQGDVERGGVGSLLGDVQETRAARDHGNSAVPALMPSACKWYEVAVRWGYDKTAGQTFGGRLQSRSTSGTRRHGLPLPQGMVAESVDYSASCVAAAVQRRLHPLDVVGESDAAR